MKRNLMLFLVSALLVCSLTACGCASKDAGSAQNNTGTTDTMQPEANPNDTPDAVPPVDRPENGTDDAVIDDGTAVRPGDSILEDAGDAIENGVNDAADAITGNDAVNGDGVSIDDMLRNGRVRDN